MREYVAVRFGRGTGLGNRMFTWARAALYARSQNAPMLAPFWPRWTTTGLIRGGLDHKSFLRQISLVGAFENAPDYIKGGEKLRRLLGAKRVAEDSIENPGANDTFVRVFRGEGRQFADINGHNKELLSEYRLIVKHNWRQFVEKSPKFVIGINIRRGKDFKDARTEEEFLTRGAVRTPLWWFVDALRYTRSVLGSEAPALLVSDGTESDLAPVLAEGSVSLLRPGCASSDLYALSRSLVLIGSGGSSFSAWASFFARCPTITIKGQSLRWFSLDHGDDIFVGEFHPDSRPDLFHQNLNELKQRLERSEW